MSQLSEEQTISCEGQITAEECNGILETFQNNKSAGNDGIPIDFCCYRICQPFIKCINESFVNEEMLKLPKASCH